MGALNTGFYGVNALPDGRILAAGRPGNYYAHVFAARLLANGSLDSSYQAGTDPGIAIFLAPIRAGSARTAVVDAAGRAFFSSQAGGQVTLLALEADGRPSPALGGGGVRVYPLPPGFFYSDNAIDLDRAGRIVVAGQALEDVTGRQPSHAWLMRFEAVPASSPSPGGTGNASGKGRLLPTGGRHRQGHLSSSSKRLRTSEAEAEDPYLQGPRGEGLLPGGM